MKFRKKPIVVEAHQWFKNGDHPEDNSEPVAGTNWLTEGGVVRRFRRPDIRAGTLCDKCEDRFDNHGWIDTLDGGHIVCPGDWIITGVEDERYPCKPDIFKKTYEPVKGSGACDAIA